MILYEREALRLSGLNLKDQMRELSDLEIKEKTEIVKQALLDQWSLQVAFAKAKIKPQSKAYFIIYANLFHLIAEYKAKKIDQKRYKT